MSASREEESTSDTHISENDAETSTRIEQQPTPPAELSEESLARPPTSAKAGKSPMRTVKVPVPTPKDVEKEEHNERRLSRIINSAARKQREEQEMEKPLSECDDDEFAARFPEALKNYNNVFKIRKTNPGPVEWVSGSNAIFVVKDNKPNETAVSTLLCLY